MKLVIEAAHKAGSIADDPEDMHVDGGFLVRVNAGDEESLKKLKAGNRFYPYVDEEGGLSQTGGIFKHDPTGNEVTSLSAFRDAAATALSLEPRRSLFGKPDQQELHRETMGLQGSRITPSYMDIEKVQLSTSDLGGGRLLPYAYITGRIYRVKDPRLDYLGSKETTRFGKGKFDVENIKALPSGNFLHLLLSPYAKQIEKLVEAQKEAFDHYSSLYENPSADADEKELWVSKYEHTRKLLKPHANEIYKYQDGFIYYINTGGNWQSEAVAGLRNLDAEDRDRIYKHLIGMDDLKGKRQSLSTKSLLDQRKLPNIAAALQPHVLENHKKDQDDIDRRQKKLETIKPTDGPLGTNDLPGLKDGVTLFPHQSMILASLKDRDRMLVDADPGAGKALVIICDILQQMKARKVKRPLVLMPESLLPQFAREVKHFSELNPWIISTESIKKWGTTGKLPEFIEDAKKAPRNTVFLTSYTWVSLEPERVDNGEISEDGGKISYRKTKYFDRVHVLLNQLKIDAIYQDECFFYNSRVLMADGRWECIGKLVNNKSQEEVLAYSNEQHKFVAKKIVGHVKNPRLYPWWELEFVFGRKLHCTPNHEFYTPNGLKRAEELTVDDYVLERSLSLTHIQKQCILGSLLGDASLGRDPKNIMTRFRVSHSDKQRDYLFLKQDILRPFIRTEAKKFVNGGWGKFIWCMSTLCLPIFDNIWSLVYRGTQKGKPCRLITRDILDQLDEIGLAFWFMDDGSMNCNTTKVGVVPSQFSFATHRYSYEEQIIMQQWFKERWDLDVTIEEDKRGRGYYLNSVGGKIVCEKLLSLVQPYIHESLAYKAASREVGNFWSTYTYETEFGLVPSKILYSGPSRLASMEKENVVYCLEIEDEHNFICESKLVSNCHVLKGNSNMAKASAGFAEVPIVRGLTGTVMSGSPYDATAPMSYIHSSVFGTHDDFMDDYTVNGSLNEYKKDAPKQIRQKLRDYGVISVRRSAWAHLLPKIHREFHYADFNPEQKKAYTALLVNILDEIRKDPTLSILLKKVEDSLANGEDLDAGPLLARFTPLDIFLNSPAEAKDWLKTVLTGINAVSPKAKVVNEIIKNHLANPEAGKVLVFVQYKEAARNLLNNIDPELRSQASYYEGGMNEVLAQFKTPHDPLKILFAVDKSLVTGHNLQAANCIIHGDLKWMPGDLYQREARAARIGQKRDVYIHTVLMRGSSEILKMARLISSEHMIAKANSDFVDTKVLQPMRMTLGNMQSFTEEHQLTPYIDRKKSIEASVDAQSVKDKDVYGPTMMRPHGYSPINKLFAEAKELKKVPSARDFLGDARDPDALAAQDLADMPTDPKHPKLLHFDLMQWDNDWYVYSFKTADPDGFLRQLGFTLMRGYYYVELPSKAGVDNVVAKLEKSLTITNKPEFEKQVRESRVVAQGVKSGLRKAAQKARQRVAAKIELDEGSDKAKKGEIVLQFSIMDGTPVIWVYDILSSNDPELPILKRAGFEQEPAFWKKPTTRSQIKLFLTKIQTNYPQARVANWEDFKSIAHLAFKGLDLTEFDTLAAKK